MSFGSVLRAHELSVRTKDPLKIVHIGLFGGLRLIILDLGFRPRFLD